MITRDKVERNKVSIVVVLIFLLIFLARILLGSKLSIGEIFLNLPLYLIVGLVYGIILQLLNKWLSTKGLLSLLIYPIFGMAILFQFLYPPIWTIGWEPAAALYNNETHVADVFFVSGNCKNTPLGYTVTPVQKPTEWYELGRLIRLSSLDKCACRLHSECIPNLSTAIIESELLNQTNGSIQFYEKEVFSYQGAYLAMPIAEEGCHYSGFVKLVAVPTWRSYLREGGKLCYD